MHSIYTILFELSQHHFAKRPPTNNLQQLEFTDTHSLALHIWSSEYIEIIFNVVFLLLCFGVLLGVSWGYAATFCCYFIAHFGYYYQLSIYIIFSNYTFYISVFIIKTYYLIIKIKKIYIYSTFNKNNKFCNNLWNWFNKSLVTLIIW